MVFFIIDSKRKGICGKNLCGNEIEMKNIFKMKLIFTDLAFLIKSIKRIKIKWLHSF